MRSRHLGPGKQTDDHACATIGGVWGVQVTCCHLRFSVMNSKQLLKVVLDEHNLPFGTTENGKNWCIKALHPSDPLTEVDGIPDDCCFPSILVNYQSTYTLKPAAAATGTWSFDGQLFPHPIGLMSVELTDSTQDHTPVEFLNSQITGNNHAEKYGNFAADFVRWRLAYAGVTVYQDGPDLSNQGTMTVCQRPLEFNRTYLSTTGTSTSGVGVTVPMLPVLTAGDDIVPVFENCQNMPSAYFNNSKAGCYAPMRLSNTSHEWKSRLNAVTFNASTTASDTLNYVVVPYAATPASYPFISLTAAWAKSGAPPTYGGDPTSDFCNAYAVDICARNMSVNTSMTFFVRMGFEVQVDPGTMMSPFQKLSPPYDPTALATYQLISRELKDAYPADYNDLGEIWNVIKGVAHAVAPALNAVVPGLGLLGGVPDVLEGVYRFFKPSKNEAPVAVSQVAHDNTPTLVMPPEAASYGQFVPPTDVNIATSIGPGTVERLKTAIHDQGLGSSRTPLSSMWGRAVHSSVARPAVVLAEQPELGGFRPKSAATLARRVNLSRYGVTAQLASPKAKRKARKRARKGGFRNAQTARSPQKRNKVRGAAKVVYVGSAKSLRGIMKNKTR